MFKMVFETLQCVLSYQFFLSGIFWFLLFSFVKHFVFFLFVCFLFEVNIMNFKTVMQKMLTGEN